MNPITREFLRQAAVALNKRFGWNVIPVKGKKSLSKWKHLQAALASPDEIATMFNENWSATGMAVILGKGSGDLCVRDYDEAGAYETWAQSHQDHFRQHPTARTHRGGHVYLRTSWRPSRGSVGQGDGEFRSEGQYVVLPPSPHPVKGHYEWLIPPRGEVPWVDDPVGAGLARVRACDLYAPVRKEQPSSLTPLFSQAIQCTRPNGSASQDISSLISACLPTKTGERNARLFDLARLVKASFPDCSAGRLEEIFDLWWAVARFVVATKDRSVSLKEFLAAFDYASGIDWSGGVDSTADDLTHPATRGLFRTTQRLCRFCARLHRSGGGRPFFLSGKIAGRLMGGLGEDSGQKALSALCKVGVLKLISRGSNLTGKANFYQYQKG